MPLESDCKRIYNNLINELYVDIQQGREKIRINSFEAFDKLNEVKKVSRKKQENKPEFRRLENEENGEWALKWRMSIRKLNAGIK